MSRVLLKEVLGRYEVTVADDSAGVTFGSLAEAAGQALAMAEEAGLGEPELGPGIPPEALELGRSYRSARTPG